jgi:hypothetical protein
MRTMLLAFILSAMALPVAWSRDITGTAFDDGVYPHHKEPMLDLPPVQFSKSMDKVPEKYHSELRILRMSHDGRNKRYSHYKNFLANVILAFQKQWPSAFADVQVFMNITKDGKLDEVAIVRSGGKSADSLASKMARTLTLPEIPSALKGFDIPVLFSTSDRVRPYKLRNSHIVERRTKDESD